MRSFCSIALVLLMALGSFACTKSTEVAVEQEVSPEELQAYEQMRQQVQQQQAMVQQQLDAMQKNRQR